MTVDDIPRAWKHALAAVQVAAPEALMAGGCLRDRDLGVKVKDIDIFVPSRYAGTPDEARIMADTLRSVGWKQVGMSVDKTYSDARRFKELSGIIDARYPGCPPIQIIVGSFNMPKLISEFDFGICQISFDGTTLRRTSDYHHDRAAKVFRVVPELDDDSFIRTINRWARLKEKYPTWTFKLGSRRADPLAVAVSSI